MPIRELECITCGTRFSEVVHNSKLDAFKASAAAGEFVHRVTYDDGDLDCGACRYVEVSLVADHTVLSGYPFTTAPWLLPPVRGEDGVLRPQRVEVHSNAQYKKLLAKYNMLPPETASDRLTMYPDRVETREERVDREVQEDLKVYAHMKSNPNARRRIIKEAVAKRRIAGV